MGYMQAMCVALSKSKQRTSHCIPIIPRAARHDPTLLPPAPSIPLT